MWKMDMCINEVKISQMITTPEKAWHPIIFIRGEVASSKNSRRNFYGFNPKTGKKGMNSLPSAFASEYMGNALKQLLVHRIAWFEGVRCVLLGKELEVGFFFNRKTNRRFDYINILQSVADQMVKARYIEDDCVEFFKPVFLGWKKDADNPGVEIYL